MPPPRQLERPGARALPWRAPRRSCLSAVDPTKPGRRLRRLMPKPPWVDALEARVAARVPGHPNLLSAFKLVVITPLLVLALRQTGVLPVSEGLTATLVLAF